MSNTYFGPQQIATVDASKAVPRYAGDSCFAVDVGIFYFSLDGSTWVPRASPMGTGTTTPCAGDDARLSNARTPTSHTHAASEVTGTAVVTNDSRLSDARAPTAHKTNHEPGGSDAMAVDAAAGTGSLRTLGSTSTKACAGNDARLSDARAPNGNASGDLAGTYPNPTVKASVSLTTPVIGAATGTSLALTGALTSSGGGIGYATGAGGTVTQATSKSTGVTLSKLCGTITMNAAALAAAAIVTFTVTNTLVAAGDVVVIQHDSGGTVGAYLVVPNASAAGSFKVSVRNVSAGSLSEAIVLRFAIMRAVAA